MRYFFIVIHTPRRRKKERNPKQKQGKKFKKKQVKRDAFQSVLPIINIIIIIII